MTLHALKGFIHSFLGNRGYRISKISKPIDVKLLIEQLHPIEFPMIRIGGDGDGGYLVPNDLSGINFCFSPGVSDSSNFEMELSERGIKSFLADFSVDSPPLENNLFSFIKKFVGPYESDQTMNFQSWITSSVDSKQDLILQMDIEGAEYQTLLSCNDEVMTQFRIMVIEFHALDLLVDKEAFPIIQSCFEKILSHFEVVHIHPNNSGGIKRIAGNDIPSILEITFLRSDRVRSRKFTSQFPHVLDRPNIVQKNELVLPKSWYNQEIIPIEVLK